MHNTTSSFQHPSAPPSNVFRLGSADLPVWVAVLFAIDFALVIPPIADSLLGNPSATLSMWVDLDSERSLPAWYSSMQWFCAAVLFGMIPAVLRDRRSRAMWALGGLALVCLVFSIDEILGIHEWLGTKLDVLLPDGERAGTPFARTGVWPFVIGIPVLTVLGALVVSLARMPEPRRHGASRRLIVGFALMFTGALIVELGRNLTDGEPETDALALLQVVVEELLEMVGVTFIVWAAHGFALTHGLALVLRTPPRNA